MNQQERTYSLYELNRYVRRAIEAEMTREYWVEAEISECRENRGHCFMELIQKDDNANTPVARASAKCWQSTWAMLQPYFMRTTGQLLHAGMKVRLKVYPQFHEAYGFSWIISDIDPTYTMGDMARKRQEIIRQLKNEGIFDMQKEMTLPSFCLSIAVITSQTAAGYGDFVNQLADSPFNFKTQLFEAIMQGEQVEESIIAALNRIYDNTDAFDAVVIIRGGGATADLSGFDSLPLAENVAQFPLPIITGIGHDRDESIIDMVSNTRVKTPTAAAQLLITLAEQTMQRIRNYEERIVRQAMLRMETEQLRIARLTERIPILFSLVKTKQDARLQQLLQSMTNSIHRRINNENHRLEMLSQRAKSLDPTLMLKRGYSITLHNGRALHSSEGLTPGTEIETRLEKGTIKSVIR